MKHNIKHLPPFFFRWPPVMALLFALGLLPGRHTQASSLSLDQDFNTPFFATQVLPGRAVLLPDGKYVRFFGIDTLHDQSTGAIIRFNSDGSVDNTFSFTHDYANVGAVAPLSNGKLVVAANKTFYGVPDSFQHLK